ncbi:hypothetical protein F2Q69_00029922 [Brassica cretica]|uniref:Uncharacterized protein n=1 Tax=Brassica cretica TaxID=69181 RepID=A0A8S9RXB3_BRACR|nr:hypothetical protein F2Q69_00029922 [Brassica cretica]
MYQYIKYEVVVQEYSVGESSLAGDLTLGREGTALASGDRKYSQNLRSTIEEHRPCHFRSSTIAGVTKVREIWDIIDTSNTSPDSCVIDVKVGVDCDPIQRDSTTHDHSDALVLPSAHVDPAYDEPFGMKHQSKTLTWPIFRELHEGFCSKLFGDERDELLVESQELLQRGEIELDRSQEFKK